jgi:membrane protein
MVFLVLCFFLASITLLPLVEGIKDAAAAFQILRPFRMDVLQNLVFAAGSLGMIFATFYGLYTLVPYGKLPRSVKLVSALASALLWEAAEQGFGFYISHFDTMRRMYGTYSIVVVVAFWFYYASLTFIVGAEIGHLFGERRARRPEPCASGGTC